ncbi:MAG TPA: glutaredoxin family protein [Gallionellaceae bacterium]
MKKIIVWLLSMLLFAAVPSCVAQEAVPQSADRPADIAVFVREGCPHCARAKEFLAGLQRERPQLRITVHDVEDPAALAKLQSLAERHGEAARVPAFEVGGQLIIGYSEEAGTGQLIRQGLAQAKPALPPAGAAALGCEATLPCRNAAQEAAGPEAFTINFFGRTLSLDELGLPLFTLAMGLLDGFNPCSMWVLLLMISLLAPLNNRARMLAIAGTFVAVQGVAYFLFMAAWLNLFLLIGMSRPSEIIIAVIALLAGAVNLKDFWAYGWGVSLSIPAASRPGIYARMRGVLTAENMAAALLGTVLLAVLVQLVELMCTSGFPALFTRILTLRQLEGPAYYGYLALYDVAYMLDDIIVLAIGVTTLSQRRLQEQEGRWLKLLSGVVMVGLGVYLLFRQ